MAKFQLPCDACSENLEVSLSQAGETLRCSCGADVLVPTMRELRMHKPVGGEADEPSASSSWNVHRGVLFVAGMVVVTLAGYSHLKLAPERRSLDTTKPEIEQLRFDIQQLTPTQAWEAWVHFRQQKLDYRDTPQYVANRKRFANLSYALYVAWGFATLGVVLVISSFLIPGRHG